MPLFILGSGERLWIRNINKGSAAHQFSSVAQSCPTLCNPMNRSTPGFPVHHQLPEHMDGVKAMGLDKHPGGRTKRRREGQGIKERRGEDTGPWSTPVLELVKRGKGNPGMKMEKEQLVK